jgi:alkaline phosphatase D
MLGRISSNGAAVWIRTFKPAQVSVEVDMDGHTKTFGPVASSTESDLSVVITVTGLKPGSENPYRVLIDGVPAKTAGLTVIRTVPENGTPVRIAFGSCWHRWGIGHPQMKVLKSRKPSALLMLGDVAVQDRMGELGLHRYDYLQRDLNPAWQDFSAAVPVYAGWDDHDYAANDVAGVTDRFIAEDRSGIRQIFAQSWVNPQYGYESEQSGVFLRTRIGPCDVIMTDNRYFRLKGKGKDHFLGKEQMLWLKEQLLNCKGPFIILSCGTMWSDYVSGGKDSWGLSDPEGREEIFKLIEEHRIPGVLLISGDRHGARGFTIPRKDGFSLYEFEGASFGGRSGPPAKPAEGKH